MKLLRMMAVALMLGSVSVFAQDTTDDGAAQQAIADDPVALVEQTAVNLFEKISANREAYTADPVALREVVREDLLPLLDEKYSARLILGRAGRGVSAEQLEAFSQAMTNLLINRYADGLLQFESTEQLIVLPLVGRNDDRLTRVRTRVKLDSGGVAPVDYAFRKTDDGWKTFDVTVEGISYVTTYRNQIAPRVQADGIDTVTQQLNSGEVALND